MSDELPAAELSAALRELAATRATPPVVDGAGIRGRVMRRRRRRRAAVTLGAGAAALALTGLVLTLGLDGHPDDPVRPQIPGADGTVSAPAQSVPSAPLTPRPVSGTLRLPGRTLTVDGRVLPMHSEFAGLLRFRGPLTVVAKHASRDLAADVSSKGLIKMKVPYVVELRDAEDRPLYVGALSKPLALGDSGVTSDWIGLATEDAQWFQARIDLGDSIALMTDTTVTTTPSPA